MLAAVSLVPKCLFKKYLLSNGRAILALANIITTLLIEATVTTVLWYKLANIQSVLQRMSIRVSTSSLMLREGA